MQAKTRHLTQHKPQWLMLRFIKHVFTQTVFSSPKHSLKGSSALVVIHSYGLTTSMMQRIAAKSNHPATVFLNQQDITKPVCKIRWFNKQSEIKRCGHGTLAAAKSLTSHFNYCPREFISPSNERFNVNIKRQDAYLKLKAIGSYKTHYENELNAVCSLPIKSTYSSATLNGYTIALFNEKKDLKHLQVDFKQLAKTHGNAVIALNIVNKCNKTGTAYFRYFAPQFGVNEDEATGSAVSVIAPLLFRLYGLNEVKLVQQSSNGALLNYIYNNGHVVLN